MSNEIQSQNVDFNVWMTTVLKQAHDIGYDNGFENGVTVGYAIAMNETKAAVSDGLRNKSSECAKNMNSRKKKKE